MPMEMIAGAEDYYNMTNEMDADAALALTAESPEFADTVGIKAVDDYTLQYTCLSEKPYFDTVAAYNCLYPISQGMLDEIAGVSLPYSSASTRPSYRFVSTFVSLIS